MNVLPNPAITAESADTAEEDAPTRNMRITGQKVGPAFVTRYVLAQIGIWVALLTPSGVTLSLRVGQLDPENKASTLAIVSSAGALAAMVGTPVFGTLSDRSTSRFGQRRPFILAGFSIGVAAIFGIGYAPNVFFVGLGWVITQLAFGAAIAAVMAILPERVPHEMRGRTSGFMGVTSQVGIVFGAVLVQVVGTHGSLMFVIPAVLGTLLVLPFVLLLKEAPKTRAEVGDILFKDLATSLWISPRKHPNFALAWLGRASCWLGLQLLVTYKTYFLIDHLGYTTDNVAPVLTTSMFTLALTLSFTSICGGWISDRIGRRKPFVFAASLIFVAAMVIIAFSTSVTHFVIGVGIAGLGQGLYLSVDYALVAALLPDDRREAAKGMSVYNLSSNIPSTLAPTLAPALLSVGASQATPNYSSMYLFAALFSLIGAVVTLMLRGVR